MSCENPTTDTDALMPRRKKYDKSRTCVKCKENDGNIVVRHAVYCRVCFVSLMTFRFRRSLEPFVNAKPDGPRRTALKPLGHLTIGFSGGLGSSVLLDLIHRCYVSPDPALLNQDGGKDHPSKDPVWRKVFVCYVETCDAIPGTKDRTEEIRNLVQGLNGVEFIPLRIQDAFDISWWRKISPKSSDSSTSIDLGDEMLPFIPTDASVQSPSSALQAYLGSLPTSTALATTVSMLTRVLLQYTAFQTGSSHLVLGTSLTSLAVSLISSISQGGGFHVKEEAQEEWFPYPVAFAQGQVKSVRIIRPLRDVSTKECAVWAWWARLDVIGREQWEWPGTKPGLGRLTKDFIRGLEKDYPSTVSAIVRTCAKLAPKGESSGRCMLCERPAQAGVQEWKARIAIRSWKEPAHSNTPPPDASADALAPYLCYVCHTTLTSRGTRALPSLFASISTGHTPAVPTWTSSRVTQLHSAASAQDSVLDVETDEPVVVSRRKMGQEELRQALDGFILEY